MSAAELLEAAGLMRGRAQVATPGPWVSSECRGGDQAAHRTLGTYSLIHTGRAGFPNSAHEVALSRGFPEEREPDAAHIASWHPSVALAVADWLEFMAWQRETFASNMSDFLLDHERRALAVARTYLGEGAA